MSTFYDIITTDRSIICVFLSGFGNGQVRWRRLYRARAYASLCVCVCVCVWPDKRTSRCELESSPFNRELGENSDGHKPIM